MHSVIPQPSHAHTRKARLSGNTEAGLQQTWTCVYWVTVQHINHLAFIKLCTWWHNMSPPPASLTIISCKYENRQRLHFTTEFAKTQTTKTKNKHCAILPSLCRHCQSKAKHSRIWVQAMPFLPIKQVDLWPSDPESGVRVTWATFVPILVLLGLFVLNRQTDKCQTASSLYAPAY